MSNRPSDQWALACDIARDTVLLCDDFEAQGELAIDQAERLCALAYYLKGVACRSCGGLGRRGYASTATWHGGCGGAAITVDVCDKCWGTGRTDRTGVDLRRMARR